MEVTGKTLSLMTSWLAVILFCLFLAGLQVGAVQHDTRVKTLVETSYVLGALPPAYGNLTLPEPALINEYLRTNTTLKNYLLPSDPPLQLIKCEAYLLQMGALFNFYVVDHTNGCQVPPPMAPWPEEEYSARGRFWLFKLRGWLSFAGWPGALALLIVTVCLTKSFCQICRAQHIHVGEMLSFVFFVPIFVGLIVSFVLTMNWSEHVDELRSFNLPDPATKINPLLQANNIPLILHRCKATRRGDGGSERPLFQFYIGMPKGMCAQILAADSPYGEYLSEDPETWNDEKGEISFETFVSAFATLSFTPILLFEVIYLACFVS